MKYINLIIPRKYNGTSFQVPITNNVGNMNIYITELWMCSLLTKLIPLKNGSFIDVGVNVGQTLIKLRSVDNQIDYIGFEPNPNNLSYTNELIRINQFKNCKLIPVGLFNTDTILELNFFHDRLSDDTASLIKTLRPEQKIIRTIYVPAYQFETVNKTLAIDSIAMIKIDVEGAELEVLKGLTAAIKIHRPIILMEILPCYNIENIERIQRQGEIEIILKELSYKIIRVLKLNYKQIEKLEVLDTINIHADMELCEYVMAPSELAEEILSQNFN